MARSCPNPLAGGSRENGTLDAPLTGAQVAGMLLRSLADRCERRGVRSRLQFSDHQFQFRCGKVRSHRQAKCLATKIVGNERGNLVSRVGRREVRPDRAMHHSVPTPACDLRWPHLAVGGVSIIQPGSLANNPITSQHPFQGPPINLHGQPRNGCAGRQNRCYSHHAESPSCQADGKKIPRVRFQRGRRHGLRKGLGH